MQCMVCFFLVVWFVVSIVSILQGRKISNEFVLFSPDFSGKKLFSSLLFSSFLFVATTGVNNINNNLLKQLYIRNTNTINPIL